LRAVRVSKDILCASQVALLDEKKKVVIGPSS
jgi:hypothetical protein